MMDRCSRIQNQLHWIDPDSSSQQLDIVDLNHVEPLCTAIFQTTTLLAVEKKRAPCTGKSTTVLWTPSIGGFLLILRLANSWICSPHTSSENILPIWRHHLQESWFSINKYPMTHQCSGVVFASMYALLCEFNDHPKYHRWCGCFRSQSLFWANCETVIHDNSETWNKELWDVWRGFYLPLYSQ